MDSIIRQKIRGRQVCTQANIGRYSGNWCEAKKGHPVGYKHREINRVPKSHKSSSIMQDYLEDGMKRAIAAEPAGPHRDFLERDLDLWQQNGKPTAQSQNMPAKEMELHRTWSNGTPFCADLTDLDVQAQNERARRLLNLEKS
jgi:hypothetical protein